MKNLFQRCTYTTKSWCACFHVASTWEHGRCNFWKFLQSHHNLSKTTTNRTGDSSSLKQI